MPNLTRKLTVSWQMFATNFKDYKKTCNRHLKNGTKVSTYQAAMLTTLLNSAELSVTYHNHSQLLVLPPAVPLFHPKHTQKLFCQ